VNLAFANLKNSPEFTLTFSFDGSLEISKLSSSAQKHVKSLDFMSDHSLPFVASGLRLTESLQLLEQAGFVLSTDAPPGSTAWVQALLDGLCAISSRDALTGLPNRLQFNVALDREVDRVARAGEPALMLSVDIDNFKRVNDTYGHNAGDRVIVAVGQALAECVRPMDMLARIGGEEFSIILPNCHPAFGLKVAERIRQRVESRKIDIDLERELNVTVSIGGAFAPQWVRSSAKIWTERADRQLYRAKREGRNCARLEQTAQSVVSAEEKGMLFALTPPPIRHV
jgi:diguanylate cyclase (GGDEF)-like protein